MKSNKIIPLLIFLSQPWLSVLIYGAALTLQLRVTVRTLTGPIAAAGIGLLMHCQRKREVAKNFLSSQLLYFGHGLISFANTQLIHRV